MLGIDPNSKDDEVTEEEIRFMVEAGRESGVIDEDEKEMIQNVFEFDNVNVGKFATHRTEVSILWTDESVEEWDKTIRHSRHSRYPICDQTVDNVIGVLDTKIYFRIKDKSRENIMKTSVKPPYFVPENVRADVLFEHMKKSRKHFAVVLDEYGGMNGVVTINDLIEQIVGDINEDDDVDVNATPDIVRIDSKTWKINGSASLEDVAEELGVSLPIDDYETFGGYVFGVNGVVTDDGSSFELDSDGMHIKVLKVSDRKIEKTLVCIEQPASEKEEQENSKKAEIKYN
jgi:putative hemolysin